MSEELQANIFFFITGIAVIVFTMFLCVALYHFIRILKSVRRVMDRIEAGSEVIAEDLQGLRMYFAEESPLARFLRAIFGDRKAKKTDARTHEPRSNKSIRRIAKTELKIKDEG